MFLQSSLKINVTGILRILYFPNECQWWAKTNNLFNFELWTKEGFDYILEAKIFIQILLWTKSRQIQVGDIEEYNGEDKILVSQPKCLFYFINLDS